MIQNVAKINVRKVTLAQRKPDDEQRECCGEPWLVLANRADLDNQEQNDVTLVFERCDTLNVYIRYNGGAEQPAAGLPINFPNDPEIKGFLIDWKQYANIGGQLIQGNYDVYVETIYFGFTQKWFFNAYRLLEFNRMNTEGTIRVASRFNDYSDLYDVDFSGSGAMDMVRLRGFFGFRQPNYETKNNTEISKKRKKVFNKSSNTYSLIIEPTLECKTQRVEQLHLLHASELYISDYNKLNHYKEIIELPVILSDDDSPEFDYFEGIGTKYAKVLATFKDKISKRKSKNTGTGGDVPIPDISLNTGLVCPTPEPCAPATFNLNGIEVGTAASGGSLNVLVKNTANTQVGSLVSGDFIVPDATANVTIDGSPFQTVNIASGGSATIDVPSWTRPADWLPMPTVLPTDQTFVGLYAIFPSGNNFAAFRFTTNTGDYQVDWGDGTVTTHASNAIAEHTYDYATYDPTNTTLSTRGYKQAMIVVTPLTGNLIACSFQFRRTTTPAQNQVYATGFLDCILSMPNAASGSSISFGGTTVAHRYVERFDIKTIGACTFMTNMFNGCTSLQSVPLFDTQNVTNMQSMFNNCTSLQSVPLFNTANVTSMFQMFNSCTRLQSVPLFDTQNVTNISNMFNGCASLQTVPLFDTSSVQNFNQTFRFCTSLNTIPNLNTSAATNMGDMFALSSSLDRTDIICRVSVSFLNCQLSRDEIVNIFNNLLDRTSLASANINVSGNWGASALTAGDLLIATAKNWTVTT